MAATYLRCKCSNPVVAPTSTMFSAWVRDFYAASGMAALLAGVCGRLDADGAWWEDNGDDDGATQLNMLRGSARNTAGALEAVLLPYLCLAVASEVRHAECCYGDAKDKLYAGLERYRANHYDYRAPCPDCDPDGALRFLRYAYALFTECTWASAYGGKAWAAIAEAAIVRLETRYQERGRAIPAATAPRTGDRCPCHGRLYPDAYGPKWALRCPAEDNGPEANVVRFCRKVEVFADYVLDLEHNTGSCLNKGWLHVNFDTLHSFQDMKRNADPMDWAGAMYPRVAERVRVRRAPLAWACPKVEAKVELAPCAASTTAFGTTPKGSEYELTADPCPDGQVVVTAKYQGGSCTWATLVCGSMAAAIAYMDGLLAELVNKGTTAGKAWRAAVKCPACGKYNSAAHPCDCCPTDGPDGSAPLNPEEFSDSSGSPAGDPPAKGGTLDTYCAACDADPCTCTKSMTLHVKGCEVQITAYHGPTEGAPWPGKVEFCAEALPGEYDFSTPSIHTQVRCPTWADAKALWAKLTTAYGAGKGCCHPLRATPTKLLIVLGGKWPHAGGNPWGSPASAGSLASLPSVQGLATWTDTVGGGCKAAVNVGGTAYIVLASPIPSGGKVLVLDPDMLNVQAKTTVHGSLTDAKAVAKLAATYLVEGKEPYAALDMAATKVGV